MFLRKRIAPKIFMMLGFVALVAADTSFMIVRHSHRSAGPMADGVTGFLFGSAIASPLVWVSRRGRDGEAT